MKDTTLGARYARAMFIVTEKRDESEQALTDLKGVWEVLGAGTPAGRLLATPQVSLADKRGVVALVMEGRVLRSSALLVDLLLRKKRLREFETVISEFESLVETKLGIRRAQVVSAVPLTDSEIRRLHGELEKTTRSKVRLTTRVDPGLIGGALVRIGDRVTDRTVKGLLQGIERQLRQVAVG